MRTRRAFHSGSWYSSNPNTLSQQLSIWIDQAVEQGHCPSRETSFLISPHAGYSYSGQTAGFAYSSLHYEATDTVKTVFLLGPSHHVRLEKEAALSPCNMYETPLGPVEIDRSISGSLFGSGLFTWMPIDVDEEEHSLEMHLPFIRHCFSQGRVTEDAKDCKIKLVPILIGCPTLQQERSLATLLKPYFEDKTCIFIVSTDFCHWGTRFNFTSGGEGVEGSLPIHENIEIMDRAGMSLLEEQDHIGFHKYLRETRNTICGRYPLCILLKILDLINQERAKDSRPFRLKFTKYAQSSKVTSARDSSVSYAAAVGHPNE